MTLSTSTGSLPRALMNAGRLFPFRWLSISSTSTLQRRLPRRPDVLATAFRAEFLAEYAEKVESAEKAADTRLVSALSAFSVPLRETVFSCHSKLSALLNRFLVDSLAASAYALLARQMDETEQPEPTRACVAPAAIHPLARNAATGTRVNRASRAQNNNVPFKKYCAASAAVDSQLVQFTERGPYVSDHQEELAWRVHADRVARRHRDHCRPGRLAPARRAKSARGRQPHQVPQQPAPDGVGHHSGDRYVQVPAADV